MRRRRLYVRVSKTNIINKVQHIGLQYHKMLSCRGIGYIRIGCAGITWNGEGKLLEYFRMHAAITPSGWVVEEDKEGIIITAKQQPG